MKLTQALGLSFFYRRIAAWIVHRNPDFAFIHQRLRAFKAAQQCARDEQYWAQVLRMNAHFLDKGNCRSDSEPGHAREPYRAAKDALERLPVDWLEQDPSLQWARAVVNRYEDLQHGKRFELPTVEEMLPAEAANLLRDAILGRRSIRRFLERPVTEAKLQEIMSMVNWAPSSCNRQPIAVFASVKPDTVAECVRSCKGATGFSAYLPCFVAFCADLRTYTLPRDSWMPHVDVALGVQNCCLMAHALGMSITLLNWAHHSEEEESVLRTSLQIPPAYEIVVNGILGYPEHGMEPPLRKTDRATLFIS